MVSKGELLFLGIERHVEKLPGYLPAAVFHGNFILIFSIALILLDRLNFMEILAAWKTAAGKRLKSPSMTIV